MSNNQNELNDIMEVLEQNAGYLTDFDRDIPENDEAVIRCSAWSHIPVLQTEDEDMKYWMQNNQVPIIDHHSQNSEKLTKNIFDMRRRSQTSSESRSRSLRTPESSDTPPAEYHYSYTYQDISAEMSAMSMNQPAQEDEEAYTRTSSPESDTSSCSDWRPGPSSVDTATNGSESPEPEPESRRLSKIQKKTMTEEQLEKRRKEANKKNSKNYNKNKKSKEQNLRDEYDREKIANLKMKQEDKSTKNMIMECYTFTGTVIRISDEEFMRNFIDKPTFESKLRLIDSESTRNKFNDTTLNGLAQAFQEKRKAHNTAKDDIKTKKENTNTYGSRKSRALHSMNIAELELKMAELMYERQKLLKRLDLLKFVKKQMSSVFKFRFVGAEYPNLPREQQARFDELCQILKNDFPTSSTPSPRRQQERSF